MSDDAPINSPQEPQIQHLQHSPATARIPDSVGRGVFATGVIVMHGANEFMIDFVQGLSNPRRVAARIVLPPAVTSQFVAALDVNLGKYAQMFGAPPRPPTPVRPPENPPAPGNVPPPGSPPAPAPAQAPIADLYEQLKLPDEMLGGTYANTVSISHTGSEFCFDFITSAFPRSVVTARVYMSAAHVPELLASLRRSIGPPQ